eukprot:scaffold143257_cov115-Phaeocystis_antarctica.AAC.2
MMRAGWARRRVGGEERRGLHVAVRECVTDEGDDVDDQRQVHHVGVREGQQLGEVAALGHLAGAVALDERAEAILPRAHLDAAHGLQGL